MNKLKEVQKILHNPIVFNVYKKVEELKKKYNSELEDFKYLDNINEIEILKNKYVKYVGINDLLYYGGIYYKTENINNKTYIYLINSKKKPWKIDFDNNYIFYKERIRNINDIKRDAFNIFLKNF